MGSLPHVVEDCFGLLKLYSDGSISRSTNINLNIPIVDDGSVLWKDYLFDKHHNLHLRLYKPTLASFTKLPVLYYIHGGGFCFGSRNFPNFHNICHRLASGLGVLVVAPDYRLAPEHRLPAAIDDAMSSLKWLQTLAMHGGIGCDTWLGDGVVDFDRVFVMGDSSGGNVAHHVAVRLGMGLVELEPVRMRGYVLLAPFFGGSVKTRSEEERPCEVFWNLDMYNRFWRLSLPIGGAKDHPLMNPFGPSSPKLAEVNLNPMLVVVGSDEILKDRVEDYAKKLKELGKKIEYVEFEGKQHGFFTDHPFSEVAERVIQIIKGFVAENSD
ncbi:probable carboxylesterase 15 [Quercus lobata]|uniref:Alpha/beta hydrolase fold-3 domain-containing protein n=1 Tax=Quercus lobata TaxID=97700 RepID=A0A7N2L6W6_QUELO|nr:probable carboxylesterase 15 [Quercus lobata]